MIPIFFSLYAVYRMAQNFDGENIDEFDKFISIHQHLPIKIFP